MGDEDDLDVPVLRADELVEQEEEAPGEVLLHRVHRAGRVHDADHDGVRLLLHVGDHVPVGEVVLVEREAPLGAAHGRHRGLSGVFPVAPQARGGELAAHPLARRAPLVEPDADADGAIALALRDPVGFQLAQRLAFEVGQLEVLEHDVDQLLERDVGLVVVGAWLVPGLVLALAGLLGLADHLAVLRLAGALADAGDVVAVDELVFADAADRDLDDLVPVLPDDRLLRDDVGDVLADGLANLQAVTGAVARRAVTAFGVGGVERPEDRLDGAAHGCRAGAGQSFQRLLAAYLSTTSTQLGQ